MDETSISLNTGETKLLTATIEPENATNKNLTWSSDNPSVATVSDGMVTSVAAGTANITATTNNGKMQATCLVTVNNMDTFEVAVTGISLNETATSLNIGETKLLTATVEPENATNKNLTWSSDNPSVAAVSDGMITALAAGTANITVTTNDGSKTAICLVTVESEDNNNPDTNANSASASNDSESDSFEANEQSNSNAAKIENVTSKVTGNNSLQINTQVIEGKAKVSEISDKNINDLLKADTTDKTNTVTIDVTTASQSVKSVELSKTTFSRLTGLVNDDTNKIDSIAIKTKYVTVTLDKTTMNAVLNQATGQSINLVVDNKNQKTQLNTQQQQAIANKTSVQAFEAYFESNGQRIGDFKGGSAVLSINFKTVEGSLAKFYHVYYLANDGTMTRYATKVTNNRLEFTADHFSDYVIIYDSNDLNETENTTVVQHDYYLIQKGDNFWKLAKKFGIDLKTLLSLNESLAKQRYIYPGQKMNIIY